MTVIETNDLTKTFGDLTAVDSLNLAIEEGEIYGFLGPNGAGKSTTINMLLDLIRRSSGSATVLGYDPEENAKKIRQRIGVLPEGGELYDRLTGREHLTWMANSKGADDDIEAMLERVGLSAEDGKRPVGEYSKGMQQRLAFGMALIGDPDLLILDEPSSGLDPTGMQEMREIIKEEADGGRTVFFSSHILGEVEAVCDRVGIMNEGRLVAEGTLDDLRGDLDLGASISVEVSDPPRASALESLDGVRGVTVRDHTVDATLTGPEAKVRVVTDLDDRTTVEDIISEDTSLEQLFNTYTGNGEANTADSGQAVESAEEAETRQEVAQ
ncbi:ATP-binding cassette domain-containing protein [Halovenus sp. WSH3]|uniref:ATP-binding cassette domain-containing protein n=1 Tax=Halovenus carboxidivorans TaxID=2692199 RepID=A0A6B0T9K0_9EURY|nr:ABC transporter ATP-binding protein [Halovenus carboxidivorans]MXR51540.1 ATP-binding cassette domain-containing protein [Halovenus carboxidivorans]